MSNAAMQRAREYADRVYDANQEWEIRINHVEQAFLDGYAFAHIEVDKIKSALIRLLREADDETKRAAAIDAGLRAIE